MSPINLRKATKFKDLPLGLEDFQEIREGNYYYVDKTHHIEKLTISPSTGPSTGMKKKGFYFLSRPRRFGKSLLLDTIQCLFEGKKDLFKGLHIYDKWDWSEKHPVIRITFGSGQYLSPMDIEDIILHQITSIRGKYRLRKYRLWPDISDIAISINKFIEIFFRQKIHEKNKKVMISSAKGMSF